jgi:hypothetical protein
MKAAAFVRYHSGDGAGHIAWAFEVEGPYSVCGSVENHSGHIFTPATAMGYWNAMGTDPEREMRERSYDDVKWIDVQTPNPLAAYRTMLWVKTQAYFAIHRNCEDDVYDILRAYGVKHLPPPLLHWFPKGWFRALPGDVTAIRHGEVSNHSEQSGAQPQITQSLLKAKPKRPTWRQPWHPHFHLLNLEKLTRFIAHMRLWAKHAKR